MTERSNEYRRRAEEADELVNKSNDPEVRKLYETVAKRWRELAAIIEDNNHTLAP